MRSDQNIYFPVEDKERIKIRQQLGFTNETLLFLFVGRFVEKKGLHILQKLASAFQFVNWVFIGQGHFDPGKWKLSNVSVFYDLWGQETVKFYQAADLLVLPSKGEGFPLVVQEAMSCGTPIIVGTETKVADVRLEHLLFSEDVIGNKVIEKWTEKINKLIQDKSLLLSMRPKISQFSCNYWSWDKCAKQYHDVIKSIVETKNK